MPILTDREYSKLAAAAAKDLVDSQIPLNDSIDKLASSYDMNDDQLARLCEASNNAAFNALFEARGKQGADVDEPAAGSHRRRMYLATARTITGVITLVGTAATTGETYIDVVYSLPSATYITAATFVAT